MNYKLQTINPEEFRAPSEYGVYSLRFHRFHKVYTLNLQRRQNRKVTEFVEDTAAWRMINIRVDLL